jgi:zinc transport system permease protein
VGELTSWLDERFIDFCRLFPEDTYFSYLFNVKALVAVILVSLICGAVGSMVVGNRMAFFSDALAHCAFAGVGLGLLLALLTAAKTVNEVYHLVTPVMILFGVLVGLGIALVREKTKLASDTVIGVFFAGAIGFGAIILQALSRRTFFNPENFLFGDPLTVGTPDLVYLCLLAILTAVVLAWLYNRLVFTSFNPTLARSRQIPTRLCNYLFIILLAVIVNMSIQIVGALLINGLLIVPAATAANLSRNMRQLFWSTIFLSLGAGVGGALLSWEFSSRVVRLGTGGPVVVLSVMLFFFSMWIGPWLGNRLRVRPVPREPKDGDPTSLSPSDLAKQP